MSREPHKSSLRKNSVRYSTVSCKERKKAEKALSAIKFSLKELEVHFRKVSLQILGNGCTVLHSEQTKKRMNLGDPPLNNVLSN